MKKQLVFIIILTVIFSLIANINIPYAASSSESVIEQNANTLVDLGIMKGYEDGTLRLDNKIKRSEFITLVVKMMGYDKDTNLENTKITFKDLKKNHWAYNNIGLALKYELVTGYPDNTIAPDKDVTYAEALAVVIRALGYEKSLKGKWPDNVVNKGSELNLNKNLSLSPNQPLTRGEMSVIIYNALTVNFAAN
ncbi:S-layer homology domain-containing protein [Acetivibrio clariflavus]|uniref:Putative S-layer protein n=1 Tax=Acetivibrio clariflavus (strain DSM 19732 / NBRC 101661 / EBR45) TaxID=720554 RepID=G8LYQ8_ACECE|nr:S-layer homology domain-containing protein [Acetivibrio clariflavus]AEV66776.1 putative S-layer protein [Acetivibrio clariflavus DSM 19732]